MNGCFSQRAASLACVRTSEHVEFYLLRPGSRLDSSLLGFEKMAPPIARGLTLLGITLLLVVAMQACCNAVSASDPLPDEPGAAGACLCWLVPGSNLTRRSNRRQSIYLWCMQRLSAEPHCIKRPERGLLRCINVRHMSRRLRPW